MRAIAPLFISITRTSPGKYSYLFTDTLLGLIELKLIYELFVGTLGMPKWLEVNSIDELKNKLISIVITALSVQFLTKGVSSTTGDLISFGGGVAMVIASLALYLYLSKQKSGAKAKEINEYYELEKVTIEPKI